MLVYCKPDQYNAFVTCTSTGKAAVAIGGTTVHTAFRLTQKGITNITDSEKNMLCTVFQNICSLIINEFSMMSSKLAAQLDVCLREITYKLNKPFGGLDVIMCGDLVKASEVYMRSATQFKLITKELPWHHLSYFPLMRVVRQKDHRYCTLLAKIGDGCALDDDEIALLESRFISAIETLTKEGMVKVFTGAPRYAQTSYVTWKVCICQELFPQIWIV